MRQSIPARSSGDVARIRRHRHLSFTDPTQAQIEDRAAGCPVNGARATKSTGDALRASRDIIAIKRVTTTFMDQLVRRRSASAQRCDACVKSSGSCAEKNATCLKSCRPGIGRQPRDVHMRHDRCRNIRRLLHHWGLRYNALASCTSSSSSSTLSSAPPQTYQPSARRARRSYQPPVREA